MYFRIIGVMAVLIVSVGTSGQVFAQDVFAASLQVLSEGVLYQRAGTSNFIEIQSEGVVAPGDVIRTSGDGSARITFFEDGTDTVILPNSEFQITRFEQDGEQFNIAVSVMVGQTEQRLKRAMDAGSSYDIETPGVILAARGTEFAIRVEDSGRSAMLVSEGTVAASADGTDANVAPGFGVRSAVGEELSEVIRATTFAELDSALDGCRAQVVDTVDVQYNIRVSPSRTSDIIGTISPEEVDTITGQSIQGGWYRIAYEDGFGWSQFVRIIIDEDCPGLRRYNGNDLLPSN